MSRYPTIEAWAEETLPLAQDKRTSLHTDEVADCDRPFAIGTVSSFCERLKALFISLGLEHEIHVLFTISLKGDLGPIGFDATTNTELERDQSHTPPEIWLFGPAPVPRSRPDENPLAYDVASNHYGILDLATALGLPPFLSLLEYEEWREKSYGPEEPFTRFVRGEFRVAPNLVYT